MPGKNKSYPPISEERMIIKNGIRNGLAAN